MRHFTSVRDIARGIVTAMEHPDAVNEDFNLASPHGVTISELAGMIWRRLRGCEPRIAHDDPYAHDVQVRIPSVAKARDMLGFEATVTLEEMLDEVITSVASQQEKAAACA